MRIIGGRLKGIRIQAPKNLPVRPTTDMAKEALFNILQNVIEIPESEILDLFSGTGNISLEFASRNALSVKSVDRDFGCFNFLKSTANQYRLNQIKALKLDVFKFLKQENSQYDLIFADPPYDLNRIPEIAILVFEQNLLKSNGILIIEHQSMQNLSSHPNFYDKRIYSNSAFSFFKPNQS